MARRLANRIQQSGYVRFCQKERSIAVPATGSCIIHQPESVELGDLSGELLGGRTIEAQNSLGHIPAHAGGKLIE